MNGQIQINGTNVSRNLTKAGLENQNAAPPKHLNSIEHKKHLTQWESMMKTVSNYIPIDRRIAYNKGETLPDRTQGAALFADISGFTPLTGKLVKELGARRGVEVLTQQLNRVYGNVIEEVHRFGGSVVSFSGDAITCWFDQDTGRLAVGCAFAMQKVMDNLKTIKTPTGTEIALGIKVAVVAGKARRFVVGNPDAQYIDVLAGEILDRVAACEQLLHSGEIGLGREIVQAMHGEAYINEWRYNSGEEGVKEKQFAIVQTISQKIDPKPWPKVSPVDEETGKQWVLPIIYDRLNLGKDQYLAELRSSIALFIQFSGIHYDQDDHAGDKLDRFIRYCQKVLKRYEGELWQITVGDKGSYLYAGFGALVSHEDDPVRVVSASFELRNLPSELDYIQEIRIGISKGQMYAGWYGGANRKTYAMLGNEVNIAARLMNNAHQGEILLSPKVARLVRNHFDLKGLASIQLKGLDQPMPIFSVLKPKENRFEDKEQVSQPMFGRSEEKKEILKLIENLIQGESNNLIIEGEAGIGKSRLLKELLDQAKKRDLQLFMGWGDAIEKSTPYFAFRPLLQALFGLEPEDDEQTSIKKIFETIGEDSWLKGRVPLLTEILPVNIEDNELTSRLEGEIRKDNTRELILRVLEKNRWLETLPAIFVFDDVHWLDSLSWPVIQAIHQSFSSILLVLVTRPMSAPIPIEYSALLNTPETTLMLLETLPPETIQAMLCQRLGVQKLSAELGDLIREKAEGHPFFSEEMAYILRDSGRLKIENGVCEVIESLKGSRNLGLPDTIEGIIMSRIDQLPSSTQVLLKVASVIGRVFSTELLKAIHPVVEDRNQLDEYLRKLEKNNFTFQETEGTDLTYIFKHIITQQVAYSLMLYSQRQELHRSVARWYELDFKGDLSALYPLLAHHWEKANNWEKMIEYLEKAGDVATHTSANQEAILFFTQIMEFVDFKKLKIDPKRRSHWEFSLGNAQIGTGQLPKGEKHLEKSLKLLKRALPKGPKLLFFKTIKEVIHQILYRTILPSQEQIAPEQDIVIREIRILEKLLYSYFITGKKFISLYTAIHALNISEKVGVSPERAARYIALGLICGTIAKHNWAEWYIRRGLQTIQKFDDSPVFTESRGVAALYYTGKGGEDFSKAETLYIETLEKANKFGDNSWIGSVLASLPDFYSLQGKLELRDQYMKEFHDFSKKSMDPKDKKAYWNCKSRNLLLKDKHEEALAELSKINPAKEKIMYILHYYHGMRSKALLHRSQQHDSNTKLFQRDRQMMLDAVKQFLEIGGSSPFFPITFACSGIAESMHALLESNPDDPEIQRLAKKFQKLLKEVSTMIPIALPIYWRWQGILCRLRGKHKKAIEHWNRSLTHAKHLGLPLEEALTCYETGKSLPRENSEHGKHLKKAIEIFSRLGATYYERQAIKKLNDSNSC